MGMPATVAAAGGSLGPASDALRFATSAGSQYPTRCNARRDFANFLRPSPRMKCGNDKAMFNCTTW